MPWLNLQEDLADLFEEAQQDIAERDREIHERWRNEALERQREQRRDYYQKLLLSPRLKEVRAYQKDYHRKRRQDPVFREYDRLAAQGRYKKRREEPSVREHDRKRAKAYRDTHKPDAAKKLVERE